MDALTYRVRLRDASSEGIIELTEIAHDKPMYPQSLCVRGDPSKG